jgi:hypothetical protein
MEIGYCTNLRVGAILLFLKIHFMKKAKIMLAVIAIVALVGGSLAFRAYKVPNGIYVGSEVGGECIFEAGVTISNEGVVR